MNGAQFQGKEASESSRNSNAAYFLNRPLGCEWSTIPGQGSFRELSELNDLARPTKHEIFINLISDHSFSFSVVILFGLQLVIWVRGVVVCNSIVCFIENSLYLSEPIRFLLSIL